MNFEFNSTRLSIARKRRRLSKKALAAEVGVAQMTITRLEKNGGNPEPETVDRISKTLGYPPDFFYGPDIEPPSSDAASFRSLSSMSASERDAALSAGAIAYIIMDWVDEQFNLPDIDLLDFRHEPDPAAAARTLRQHWGLGEKPISDVTKLLESKGVRVFTLAENTKKVDAFCCWRDDTPYIFLNTMKTAERSRFDALHELGHLVMHRHGNPTGRQAEVEANMFASHFLMPPADIASQIPLITSLGQIANHKRRWGVSVAALAYRLHKDGFISDWQYRGFCIEINERFRAMEPHPLEREISSVWTQVLRALWTDGVSLGQLASKLNLPESEVGELLFSLSGVKNQEATRRKAPLRLV